MTQDSLRRTDLDALRGVAMVLGIVLHVSLSFFPSPWPIQDTRQNPSYFLAYAAIHMFRMPLFFIISGFFTMYILSRQGLAGMLRQRVQRILLPLLLALLTIVPIDNLIRKEARMLHSPDPSRRGAFVNAIIAGNRNEVIRLLNMGSSVNQEDPAYGLTPLSWSALSGDTGMISLLLDRGADLQKRDSFGNTPLHNAAYYGQIPAVRLLLQRGADPLARNKAGWTPYVYCYGSMEFKESYAARLGLPPPDKTTLRKRTAEVAGILRASAGSGAATFSSWLDRVTTCYRGVLLSDGFVIHAGGHSLHLFDETLFDHLWFLWLLLWLIAVLALAVWMGFPPTGGYLCWIPPITLIPQLFMGTAFGPDLWLGPLPPPHLLLYYGLFFWFGAAVFSRDGMETRMGAAWKLFLPLGLLVLLPSAVLLIGHRLAGSIVQCTYAWMLSLGIIGLFGSYCSRLGYRARWFSDSTYWMYLAHLPLVLALQLAVIPLAWPVSVKFSLVLAVATILLLASYRWMVRYTWIGTLLNGPRTFPGKAPGDAPFRRS